MLQRYNFNCNLLITQTMSTDSITPKELKDVLNNENNALILHIFNDKKFEQEHIPGSYSAPVKRLNIVPDLVEEKDREIILYGEDENRSQASSAVNKLQNMSFENIKVLNGGLKAWKSEGNPLNGKKHIPN